MDDQAAIGDSMGQNPHLQGDLENPVNRSNHLGGFCILKGPQRQPEAFLITLVLSIGVALSRPDRALGCKAQKWEHFAACLIQQSRQMLN